MTTPTSKIKVRSPETASKVKVRSPEMLQLVHATYRFRDELGLDDQPEIYEHAARSPENAKKIADLFHRVDNAVCDLMAFFEVEFDSIEALDAYESEPLRSSASDEERIERMGSTYHKAINNFKANDSQKD